MQHCLICKTTPVIFPRTFPDGTALNLCENCYEIKFLCDGIKIDFNVDKIEEVLLRTKECDINFVRSLTQEIN